MSISPAQLQFTVGGNLGGPGSVRQSLTQEPISGGHFPGIKLAGPGDNGVDDRTPENRSASMDNAAEKTAATPAIQPPGMGGE